MRIIFLGTPDFAAASLKALVEAGYNVVACVTMPDKPAGRGHHLQQSPVKQYAVDHNIPVLQPERLKDEQFVEQLRSYKADLQIVVAFRMLPEVVWSMPRLGTFNLHGSLLPQYRGAAPINWAVINGDKETGVTTFFLKHDIDTGDMIMQERISIGAEEDAGSVHDRLMVLGADVVCRTTALIQHADENGQTVHTEPQPENIELRPAPKLFKENTRIPDGLTAAQLQNFVRGLSPYPAAWTDLRIGGSVFENTKIYAVRPLTRDGIDTDHRLTITATDGVCEILELQVPGKRRMHAKDFLNGLKGFAH